MGKGRRNRERSMQDRLAAPAAKHLKNKKKSGMPSWLTSVIAIAVVVVILLPLIISAVQESGFFARRRVLIESQTGEFDVNQQMATFIAWEALYESGLQYYQYVQMNIIQDNSGITSLYTADEYAMNMALSGIRNNLRDCVDNVSEMLKQYVAVCDLAHKENVTLTEEDKAQVEEVVAWLNNMRANTAFTSLDKFLGYTIGTGVKEKDVRAASEMVILYNKYVEQKQLDLDGKITLDNLTDYREENPDAFYKMDYLTFAVKDKELSEQLKACKTPLDFANLVIKIHFDENYKTLYNKYTLQVEVKDILKDKLDGKTDGNDGTALSDAWKELGVTSNTEYKEDGDKLDADLSKWLFASARKQYESTVITAKDGVYLVSFYSEKANQDAVQARVKFYEFKDGASHDGDDKFMETLLKVLTAENNGSEEKVEYDYKTASKKANDLRDALTAKDADIEKILKDNAATEVKDLTDDDTKVPADIRKNVFADGVEAGKTLLVVDDDNDVYYVVYVRALNKPADEAVTADAESEAKKATADIAYVETETDLFCTLLDDLTEALDDIDPSEPATASFRSEPEEGSYLEFLFELKEGEGRVSARKHGDTIVIEKTDETKKETTYTVYMAVQNTDYDEKGEMLYYLKDRLVNGGYLLFDEEDAAKEAKDSLAGKTGDELYAALADLESDNSDNSPKVSSSNKRATIDAANKDMGAWMFDEARKENEVTIIEKKDSDDKVEGYYLVVYVDHEIEWEKTARSSLLNEQLQDWIEELAAPYTVNEKVLKKIGEPSTTAAEEEHDHDH